MANRYDPAVRALSQMRQNRKHLARDDVWIKRFLKQATYCTVGTSWDDLPFLNPTAFWYEEARHRIVFHSNATGWMRANVEHNPRVCVSVQEMGRFLPSNAPLEVSVQFRGVVMFGTAEVIDDPQEVRAALQGLLAKYFLKLRIGAEFQPISDTDLRRTSVYEIRISEWSGKENWPEQAEQMDGWTPLSDEILAGGFE
jgi:nitroimidazol reductase NimA-like FMN-containing flavoprotein (pyridoxamine 5'-phosphate oxidase superfamily)